MTPPLTPPAHKSAYTEPKYTTEEIIEQFLQLSLPEIKASVSIYNANYNGSQITILYNQRVPYGLATAVQLGKKESAEMFVALSPMQKERLFSFDAMTKAGTMKQLLDFLIAQRDAFIEAAFAIESVQTVGISKTEMHELRSMGVQIQDVNGNSVDSDSDDGDGDSNDSPRITH